MIHLANLFNTKRCFFANHKTLRQETENSLLGFTCHVGLQVGFTDLEAVSTITTVKLVGHSAAVIQTRKQGGGRGGATFLVWS